MSLKNPIISSSIADIPPKARKIEALESALKELFFIENPSFKKKEAGSLQPELKEFIKKRKEESVWVYFPWNNTALHIPKEELYYKLRTARNRNIITEREQLEYRNFSAGIAGLSVGSSVLSALAVSGGPKMLKISDPDIIEISNLNRIQAALSDVGVNKSEVAARRVWELDPFAQIIIKEEGISEKNLEEFIVGDAPLRVFIDEMDSLDFKIRIRMICKKHRIPVLMGTDNGDGVVIDVERFDQEPDRPLFHGNIGDMTPEKLKETSYMEWLELATKIVGAEYLPERMLESLAEIGKTITALPQLGASAAIVGSAVAYAVRRIANDRPLPSGKYVINLEDVYEPDYNSPKKKESRGQKLKSFFNAFENHARTQ